MYDYFVGLYNTVDTFTTVYIQYISIFNICEQKKQNLNISKNIVNQRQFKLNYLIKKLSERKILSRLVRDIARLIPFFSFVRYTQYYYNRIQPYSKVLNQNYHLYTLIFGTSFCFLYRGVIELKSSMVINAFIIFHLYYAFMNGQFCAFYLLNVRLCVWMQTFTYC